MTDILRYIKEGEIQKVKDIFDTSKYDSTYSIVLIAYAIRYDKSDIALWIHHKSKFYESTYSYVMFDTILAQCLENKNINLFMYIVSDIASHKGYVDISDNIVTDIIQRNDFDLFKIIFNNEKFQLPGYFCLIRTSVKIGRLNFIVCILDKVISRSKENQTYGMLISFLHDELYHREPSSSPYAYDMDEETKLYLTDTLNYLRDLDKSK